MDISRRGLLLGGAALLAAPAIVRAGLIMPVKTVFVPQAWIPLDGRKIDRWAYPKLYQLATLHHESGRFPVMPSHFIRTDHRVDMPMNMTIPVGSIWLMQASL